MTRRRDRMVFVSGELGSEKAGSLLLLYELGDGAPPAVPQHFCRFAGASGSFSSPSWSPDGRKLAWADGRGIWSGVGDLSGDVCQVRKRMAIPRGTSPDWGPAEPAGNDSTMRREALADLIVAAHVATSRRRSHAAQRRAA